MIVGGIIGFLLGIVATRSLMHVQAKEIRRVRVAANDLDPSYGIQPIDLYWFKKAGNA